MNESTKGNPIGNFGAAPARPIGWRKGLQSVGMMWRLGIVGGVGILALAAIDAAVPENVSPLRVVGDSIGAFGAAIIKREQENTRDAIARNVEAQADAAARAEARKNEQLLLAQHVQGTRDVLLMPQIGGSLLAQGFCLWGQFTGDRQKMAACGMVQPMNEAIMQQQAGALDALGPTRVWGDQQSQVGGPTYAATADAPPLSRGEYEKIAYLEKFVTATVAQQATAGLNMNSNRGQRMYLARLAVAAGDVGGDEGTLNDGKPHFQVHVTHRTP